MEEKNAVSTYKTVLEGGAGEIEEKKSRFIATVRPVSSEEEALAFIEEMKKKYWDARHNCSAYTIGRRMELMRASDDGEPQGTAGRPMLDVLTGQGICNAAVVVTRYFGGVLLGTGGLVRAYSAAVQAGLAASTVVEKIYGAQLDIRVEYTDLGKVQYIIGQNKIPMLGSEYADGVTLHVILPAEEEQRFAKNLADATSGRAVIEKTGSAYYCEAGGKYLLD